MAYRVMTLLDIFLNIYLFSYFLFVNSNNKLIENKFQIRLTICSQCFGNNYIEKRYTSFFVKTPPTQMSRKVDRFEQNLSHFLPRWRLTNRSYKNKPQTSPEYQTTLYKSGHLNYKAQKTVFILIVSYTEHCHFK